MNEWITNCNLVFVNYDYNVYVSLLSLLQYTALEAKLCQVESKYLVLLQEVKTPVCSSSEQSPAREVISRLLEDALQAESPDQQGHPIFKPNSVRYGLCQKALMNRFWWLKFFVQHEMFVKFFYNLFKLIYLNVLVLQKQLLYRILIFIHILLNIKGLKFFVNLAFF